MAPLAPPPPPPPPVTLPSSSVPVPSDSILNKTQKWVEDNKYLVLGAAIAAAGGVGYYIYSANQAASATSGGRKSKSLDSSDEEETVGGGNAAGSGGKSTASKKKKKSKSKKSKSGSGDSTTGPLLEERDPEEVKKLRERQAQAQKDLTGRGTTDEVLGELAGKSAGEEKKAEEGESGVPAHLASAPSATELKTMSNAERRQAATELKNRGNKLYASKQFESAIECYSKALEVADKEEAIYYSNRAACYQNMSPPDYEQVVKDCDAALKLDSGYVKALNRRATALENLGRDVESLRDFTALTIMERFQNEAAATSVERVLQKIAKTKAAEMLKTREPRLPSVTFVAAYLNAFRPAPKPSLPENLADSATNTGNNTLLLAIDAEAAGHYEKAFMLVNEAVDQGISEQWVEGRARGYNMRGTYKFLIGDTVGAKADFEKSLEIKPDYVQSLVKVASVHMEMGDAAAAFGDFEDAIRHNENDPDIYYHRGQLYFVTNEYTQASSDYEKSTSLDDNFVFSQVQRAVCQYKMEDVRGSMNAFRQLLKKFPGKSEPLNYYGELLLDQQRFEDAAEKFDAAIEIEKDKQPCNVLPFVNKALALFQWKQDMPAAESLCQKALDIDPECDVAIATLAQLALQQGKIAEAIEWFERSGKLARTETELTTAITYEHASRAQLDFLQNYPSMAEKLGQLAGQI